MKKKAKDVSHIDMEIMETVIAYNVIMDEVYLASIIDVLNPDYFNDENIKTVFGIVKSFFIKHNELPSPTEIKLHLKTPEQKNAFKELIKSFKDIDGNFNKLELYGNTETFLKNRAIYHAMLDVIDKQKDAEGTDALNSQEIFQTFDNACNISLIDDLGIDLFSNIDENIDRLSNSYTYQPTGYTWLDKMMGGGLLKDGRAMYVFTGVTNSGKSIILGNLTVNLIKQNKPVILISMEMSEDMYLNRLVGQITSVPLRELKNEITPIKKLSTEHINNNPKGRLFIKEFPPNTITVNHIQAYIKKLCKKKQIKPAAIVIDYLNLIKADDATGQSYTDIKRVSEQLRALSYVFGCPIITASQLNRQAMGKTDPGMENISESIGLGMTADFQAAIWTSDADKELGIIHMGIQKNRFGVNHGKQAFKINYDNLIIESMDDDFSSSTFTSDTESSIESFLK